MSFHKGSKINISMMNSDIHNSQLNLKQVHISSFRNQNKAVKTNISEIQRVQNSSIPSLLENDRQFSMNKSKRQS